MAELELTLPVAPRSAAEARNALRSLESELEEPLLADLRLLVTELVTNSVRHGDLDQRGGWIRVSISVSPARVRVDVTDSGIGFRPQHLGPAYDGSGGWGLFLVARLATRWGIERRPTRVWFEIDRAPSPATEQPVTAPVR